VVHGFGGCHQRWLANPSAPQTKDVNERSTD
jgi:hypothetical protein